MDPIKNPFSPGAGSPPPELVGRDALLAHAHVLFERVKQKRAEKSMVMIGLRGVGKTVLLNQVRQLALESGYRTAIFEAHEEKTLAQLLAPGLRELLFDLDRMANLGDKVRKGLAVLKGFLGAIRIGAEGFDIGLDIEPFKGVGDTGDLESDLPSLFTAVAEAAQAGGTGVCLLIDELQYLSKVELSALIMAMHKMQQLQLPMVLVAAGLPLLPGLAGDSKSYAERLFDFPEIGPLPESEAKNALAVPVSDAGVSFTTEALDEIFRVTQGYPYFIQEWGYQSWNTSLEPVIDLETVRMVEDRVVQRLDKNFFRVRFDRLTPMEKRFLRSMAQLGKGPFRTGDVAAMHNVDNKGMGPLRSRLIKKGMIYSPSHGELDFTVPMFDAFMRRAMDHEPVEK